MGIFSGEAILPFFCQSEVRVWMESHWARGIKVPLNDHGHMTKRAARPING